MPAAPVADPPWVTGSWSDTCWEEDTWGAGAPAEPAYLATRVVRAAGVRLVPSGDVRLERAGDVRLVLRD